MVPSGVVMTSQLSVDVDLNDIIEVTFGINVLTLGMELKEWNIEQQL